MVVKKEPRHVSATEARVHFGELLQAVDQSGETVIVERGGRELAAVIPIEEYRRRSRLPLPAEWWDESRKAHQELIQSLNGEPTPLIRDLIDAGRD